jgi:hypothetical protein
VNAGIGFVGIESSVRRLTGVATYGLSKFKRLRLSPVLLNNPELRDRLKTDRREQPSSESAHDRQIPRQMPAPKRRRATARLHALLFEFQSVKRNATRSFFSCEVSFVPRIRLKNSTESSSVIRRPS